MKLHEIIKIHTDRLKELEDDDFIQWKFNLAIIILVMGIILSVKYTIAIMFPTFLLYGYFAYKSVRW